MIISGSMLPQGINGITALKQNESLNTSGKSSFNVIFDAYVALLNETNQYQLDAERLELDYAAGRTDDIVALNLALEKASASLSFTVQVTTRIISAYQEIMRMQI